MIHHFLVLHLEYIGMMNVYVVEYVNKNSTNVRRVLWIDMVFPIVNMIIQGRISLRCSFISISAEFLDDSFINVQPVKKISSEMI